MSAPVGAAGTRERAVTSSRAMVDDPLAALTAELGAPPPEPIARLDPPHLRLLVTLIRDAKAHEDAALAAATEEALQHVPWVLRGLVKKALG